MGKALMVESGYVTAPSGAYTRVTPAGQDTFAVQNYFQGSAAYMLDMWADIDTAGSARVRSPNFHDDVNGINMEVAAASPNPLIPAYARQLLQPNDLLTVELADNGAGAPSGITLLNFYENLPGADANLFRWPEIVGSIVDFMACAVAVTPAGAIQGDYEGAVVINALQNQFKASTNYALLGYTTSTQYQTVGVTGPDTSNRRVGGPGCTPDIMDTRQWFIQISEQSGLPCIPVLNSQNMSATVVDVIDTEEKDNGTITFFFARLNTPGR